MFFFLGGGNLEENPISLQLILGNLQKHEAIPGLWADPSIKLLPYGVDWININLPCNIMKTSGMFHMVWYGNGFINRVIKCGHKWLKIVLNGVEPVGNMLNTTNVTGRQVLPAPSPEHSKKNMKSNDLQHHICSWEYAPAMNHGVLGKKNQDVSQRTKSPFSSEIWPWNLMVILMVVVFPLVDLYIHTYHTIPLHYITLRHITPKQMDELAGMLNQKKTILNDYFFKHPLC